MIDTCLVRKDDAIGTLTLELQDMSLPTKIGLLIINYYQRDKSYLLECQIKGIDTIPILLNNGVSKKIINVRHVPRMAKNLLSVQEFRKVGFGIHLGQDIYIEDKHGKRVTHLEEINGLFKIGNNP